MNNYSFTHLLQEWRQTKPTTKNMENQKKNENIKAMLKERRLKIIKET